MAGSGSSSGSGKEKYRAHKRGAKRKSKRRVKRAVVPVCNETLKNITVRADQKKLVGVVTFLTVSGKKIRRLLVYTWFTDGTWTVKFDSLGDTGAEVVVLKASGVPPALFNRVKKLNDQKKIVLFSWRRESSKKQPVDHMIQCLLKSVIGKEIPVQVAFEEFPGGNGNGIPTKPLSDDYLKELKDPRLALVYILFLEHFCSISINGRVAKGGISRREYKWIIKRKSKNPNLSPQLVARVLTQGFHEYKNAIGGPFNFLINMVETLLYQRKLKNPMAVNNQLMISMGTLRLPTGASAVDVGIKSRGPSLLLRYDKYGQAIPAFVGYMDKHYRTVYIDKVTVFKIKAGQSAFTDLYQILRQTFVYPNLEMYALMASIGEFYGFLVEEIYRQYNGEIGKKIVEMLPTAIGFFVVHAIVGAMASRGNPYAMAIIAMAKGFGWIMNIDMTFTTGKHMAEAGRHFAQMELIHRRGPKEKAKTKLTELSKYHLALGTHALIQGIAEIAAQGVFIAAGFAGKKLAGPIAKFIKAKRSQARIEITVEGGKIKTVKAVKGKTQIPVETTPSTHTLRGTGKKTSSGFELKVVDEAPVKQTGSHTGTAQKSVAPKPSAPRISPLKYAFKSVLAKINMALGKGKGASKSTQRTLETKSGMEYGHLEEAARIAKEQGVVVLVRQTNPRGVQHIKNGHPPKGKDLIALNTDPITGKVTAKGPKQAKLAQDKGYYIVGEDGYAYAKGGKTRLNGPDGKPLKLNMKELGEFGELTHRPGQVIDPKAKKAVVGDYDLLDVISPNSATRNLVGVPKKIDGDVQSLLVKKFLQLFNKRTGSKRIQHGADAQFINYKLHRDMAFKGDAFGILPDGRVVFLPNARIAAFYKAIGRQRLGVSLTKTSIEKAYR
ncbi:MAG: hypothetical protein ACE5FH_02470 [Candidatus Zixiibacteriota bacterium]